MNAVAILYVNQHLEDIRQEAALRRQHPKGASAKDQIAAAIAAVKGAFSWHTDLPASVLPKLEAYPFQS
jgi:hypothetical protein